MTPVTFSSMPSGSTFTAPPFLPAAGAGTNGPHFNVGYTENAWISPATATITIENPLANDLVPVAIAAMSLIVVGFIALDRRRSRRERKMSERLEEVTVDDVGAGGPELTPPPIPEDLPIG